MPCLNHPTVEERLRRCARCGQAFCRDCVVELAGASYCASCKEEWVRDFQSGVVMGGLELAGVGYRLVAWLIDALVLYAASCVLAMPLVLVAMGLMATQRAETSIAGLVLQLATVPLRLLVPMLYEGFMLKARGQTLGKMALSLKVVTPEGRDIRPREAWLRGLAKGVMYGCCLFPFDLLVGVFTWERTCLHDLFAKTRVVRVTR